MVECRKWPGCVTSVKTMYTPPPPLCYVTREWPITIIDCAGVNHAQLDVISPATNEQP